MATSPANPTKAAYGTRSRSTGPRAQWRQRAPSPAFHRNPRHTGRPCRVAAPSGSSAESSIPDELKAALPSSSPKLSMVSLGCPKNTVDGEVMLGDLYRQGFDIIEEHEDADAIIVNTCGFVEDAKTESIEAIIAASGFKQEGKAKKVIVTGCLAQRYSQELAEQLPEADLVVGFEQYGGLPASIRASLGLETDVDASEYAQRSRVQVGSATVPFRAEFDRFRLTPKHTAYLRVAEGCDHACTFCAIPGFRGKFRSKGYNEVLAEAKALVDSGVKELNLIAEDTNQYGMDTKDGHRLAELLRDLRKLEGLRWIRVLYAYPSYFTDSLIDEIATNPKVCKYIDMPLQHINNLVLLSMNRPTREHTEKLLFKLRDRIPGLAMRTTFISGFPGETLGQHTDLVSFVREFSFERMGAFMYSEEDGTPAADFPGQVDEDERARRRDELVSIQQEVSCKFAKSLVGTEIDVLIDGFTEDGQMIGRTQWDAPDIDPVVFIGEPEDESTPRPQVGEMRRCFVDNVSISDIDAHPVA
mmetsp:Transcript_3953/g.11192  ORF Transcript_3953/g.11192 Transcript_3953/m.11192 type:complete len:528 (-) Transcript_3953:374-1957(-)